MTDTSIGDSGTWLTDRALIRISGEAKRVIVCNFDDKPGYAGVPNPLYTQPNVTLLLGDAKDTLEQLLDSF